MTENVKNDGVRQTVRDQYAEIAKGADVGCCGKGTVSPGALGSLALGYSDEEVASAPEGSNMGLGCGNPQAIAKLQAGETVLDLGSGGGFDCFLAARQVGETGQVIGVDMTPDMLSKARAAAESIGAKNVDFRLGEIEHLPVANDSVDVVLSNCVINLSPDKAAVFRDTFRVLAPGGRLAISDIVRLSELPEAIQENAGALTGCISGAVPVTEIESLLKDAGFEQVSVEIEENSRDFIKDWLPGSGVEAHVVSAKIEAIKPAR
ncbi:MAG: arsenite methyltransferase [Myxococcota bacterium]